MHSRYCGLVQLSLWTVLVICNTNVCTGQNGGMEISRTFLGSGSYAEFPQWLTTTQGLADFSFITSAPSGLLLYIDSTGTSGDYLLIELQNGSVTVEVRVGGMNAPSLTPETHRVMFGEHLNDNQLHSIHIVHDFEFSFTLDNSISRMIIYSVDLNFDTRGSVYFGGIPESYTPDAQFNRSSIFIGCLQDIRFANRSTLQFDVMRKQPLDESNLLSGCADPCANDPCNEGVCVAQWPTEETAFCDCRGTDLAGPTCSDDLTAHQLINGDTRTYSCYSLPPDQPFSDEPNNAVIQLVPPVPRSGTIMTGLGFSADNARGFFALFLKDSKVFLKLNNMAEIEVSPTLMQTFRYRISYLQMPTHVVITINRVSSTNVLTLVDERNITLDIPLQHYDFRDICVGGVLLEIANYVGTFEYVFFRQYALAEQQNFVRFGRRIVSSSDVIRFVGNVNEPSLAFERYGLGSQKISFEFRVQPEDVNSGSGILLYSENIYSFTVSLFNGDFLILITNTRTFETILWNCNFTGLNNGSWYEVVLEMIFGIQNETPQLRLTVNDNWTCDVSDTDLEDIIQSLANSSLQFGLTTGSLFDPDSGVPFIGCVQNIVFEIGTESFSPNLEAVANFEERFEIDGCFFCTEEENEILSCENGGFCSNPGLQQLQCDCPDNFTGLSCEEPLFPTPETPPSTTSFVGTTTSTPPSRTSTTPTPGIDNAPNTDPDIGKIGMWVGIALGSTLGVVLVFLTSTCLYIFCCGRFRREGFYKTHENQSSQVSLPRYSASLQRVSSQSVSLERNGIVRNHNHVSAEQELDQDKEFFI